MQPTQTPSNVEQEKTKLSALALHGGPKARTTLFPMHRTIGKEEKEAVMAVMDDGKLSNYLGCWHPNFYGGSYVQAFEQAWASFYGVKHAIAVNSATSGLYCAMGAAGIGPGDEVIVSPYTMSASAVAPLIYNAIPVFADISPTTFCLDPASVESKITERTRAILVVDLFGFPYDAPAMRAIAKKYNLIIIEDAAQAPYAKRNGELAGTMSDMGVYSLNYHKHIHCGEGGVIVTNDDALAQKLQLIRNHAESVVEGIQASDLVNMIGFNYRMTEIHAAIATEQLKKLPALVARRMEHVAYIEQALMAHPFLKLVPLEPGVESSYYIHPLILEPEAFMAKYACTHLTVGQFRKLFLDAVTAELMPFEGRVDEGIKISGGYVRPLYLLPVFQTGEGFGSKRCPFSCAHNGQDLATTLARYKEACIVCEDMHYNRLIVHEMMVPSMQKQDIDAFITAIDKVTRWMPHLLIQA